MDAGQTDRTGPIRERWVGMDAGTGRARSIAALIAAGSLAIAACAGDEASIAVDDTTGTSGAEGASAVEDSDEVSDDGAIAEDGSEGTGNVDHESGVAPARGSLTVGDDIYELETAYHCPRRDTFEGDGEIVQHTYAFAPDMELGVNVWERVEDGVTAQRLTSDAPGVAYTEHVAVEGDEDFPIYRIEDGRVFVDGVLATTEEELRVTAEWDLPPDQIPEGIC